MRVGMGTFCILSHAPLADHPLDTHREPSALYCWILEILSCNPKGRRALLRSRLRSGEVFAFVGRNQNLNDVKDVKDGLRTQRTYCTLGETSTHPNSSPVAASLTILGV